MKSILVCFGIFLLPIFSFSQKIKPEKIAKLPPVINESSGLAKKDSALLWTMNDSGGENALYLVDKNGKLLKTLFISNARNHDWEDLAEDESYIYIGDFGNNANHRKDLKIYRVPKNYIGNPDSLRAEIILFHYPDQKQFPPLPSNWNFDGEAFFHAADSLFLFSKNRSNPNDGYTKMYRLPDQPGNYAAELIDSFQLNEPVTSADISADGKTVVLLTYFSLWVLKDFSANHFFGGKVFQFPFKGLTLKEGIVFTDTTHLMMTDEKHFGAGGKLYEIDLRKLDFTNPGTTYHVPFLKRTIYNAFNNPKSKYKKIMRRATVQ